MGNSKYMEDDSKSEFPQREIMKPVEINRIRNSFISEISASSEEGYKNDPTTLVPVPLRNEMQEVLGNKLYTLGNTDLTMPNMANNPFNINTRPNNNDSPFVNRNDPSKRRLQKISLNNIIDSEIEGLKVNCKKFISKIEQPLQTYNYDMTGFLVEEFPLKSAAVSSSLLPREKSKQEYITITKDDGSVSSVTDSLKHQRVRSRSSSSSISSRSSRSSRSSNLDKELQYILNVGQSGRTSSKSRS